MGINLSFMIFLSVRSKILPDIFISLTAVYFYA